MIIHNTKPKGNRCITTVVDQYQPPVELQWAHSSQLRMDIYILL